MIVQVHPRITLLAGLLIPALACGLEEIGGDDDDEAIPAAVQEAFDESCATNSSCHAAGTNLIVLEAPHSSAILKAAGSGGPLVTFGDLDNSYIAQKILGGPSIIGAQMPPAPQSDKDGINTALIIGWIAGVPIDEGGDDDDDDDDEEGGDGDGDGNPLCYITAPAPAAPSFAEVWPIFENRCATAGCHENLSPPLMPDQAMSWANMVGVPALSAAANYVEPGDPDGSYLWHKLVGTQSTVPGGGGLTMPYGGQMCASELQAIYAWILAGASE